MPTLYLAFANNPAQPLENLKEESREVFARLYPRKRQKHYEIHREEFPELNTIAHYLSSYRNDIHLFHFAGHASSDTLLLKDREAGATGIGTMLAQQKNLGLVFLNGCSTKEQVTFLLDKGIPAVIATSAPINDTRAKDFAVQFYQALADRHTIGQSFDMAKGYLTADRNGPSLALHRGIAIPENIQVDSQNWGLYVQNERALEWRLPDDYGLPAPPIEDSFGDFEEILKNRYTFRKNPLPEKYLVNCDRKIQLEKMLDHTITNNHHLFYFILACPEQHPVNLVKNFVFELIEESQYKDEYPIQYKCSLDFEGARSIAVHPLAARLRAENLQKEWLMQLKKENRNFRDFITQELPSQKLSHIISAFEISINNLERDKFEQFLDSFMQDFQQKANTGPKCIFFFIINVRNIHPGAALGERESAILDHLRGLSDKTPNQVFLLDSLPKVKNEDLYYWICDVLEGPDPICFFNEWAKKVHKVEIGADPNFLINMSVINSFQKRIWNYR
jgi:hypothetical protein